MFKKDESQLSPKNDMGETADFKWNSSGKTLKPDLTFNPKNDVVQLQKTLLIPNQSADKDLLINIFCHRTYQQRLQIAELFSTSSEQELVPELKKELTFAFKNLMIGLVIPYHEYLGRTVHSCGSFKWFYYLVFTISNYEMEELKQYFQLKYGQEIGAFIETYIRIGDKQYGEIYMIKIFKRIFDTKRDESIDINKSEISEDVQRLNSIVGATVAEKDILKEICYTKSFQHIHMVNDEYARLHNGNTIHMVVRKIYTFSCDRFIYENIINYAIDKNAYFAEVLMKSMKGIGTDDKLLSHVILRRCEIDLANIRDEFNRLYPETLRKWVKDDTSGHFKYALYALMGEQRSK